MNSLSLCAIYKYMPPNKCSLVSLPPRANHVTTTGICLTNAGILVNHMSQWPYDTGELMQCFQWKKCISRSAKFSSWCLLSERYKSHKVHFVGKMQFLDITTSCTYSYHWGVEGYVMHSKIQILQNFCNQKLWTLLNVRLCTKITLLT